MRLLALVCCLCIIFLDGVLSDIGCDNAQGATELDLIFVLDSSESLWVSNSDAADDDSHFVNWAAEIGFSKAIVSTSLPTDSRVAAIKFSGCSPEYNASLCENTGNLGGVIWGLTEYGSPNDQNVVVEKITHIGNIWGLTGYGSHNDQRAIVERFTEIGNNDYVGMFSWTREALKMALDEFETNSSPDRSKMLILVTNGAPSPSGYNHDPCRTSEGYVSPQVEKLRDLGVTVLVVGIALEQNDIDEYYQCMIQNDTQHLFEATSFDALEGLAEQISISEMFCSKDDNNNDAAQHLSLISLVITSIVCFCNV